MTRLADIDFSDLTPDERLLLAQQLQESVLDEIAPLTSEQLAEMQRRLDAFLSGEDPGISWEEVRAKYLPASQ